MTRVGLVLGSLLLLAGLVVVMLGNPRSIVPGETPPHFDQLVTFQVRILGNAPEGFVAFLGDSHVQGLNVQRVDPRAINLGIGGDTTTGLLRRLPKYPTLPQASAIVVAIGLNDLRYRDEVEVVGRLREVLEALPIDVPIVLSAVLPVADDSEGREGYRERIRAVNRGLKGLSSHRRGVVYVDAGPKLAGESGGLTPDNHVGDGVHLSPRGADIWIEVIRAGLERAEAERRR